MKPSSSSVFDRAGQDTISERMFYTMLALFIAYGLGATALSAHEAIKLGYQPSFIGFLGIGLVIPLVGIWVANSTDDSFVSFLGYNMVVIPFGIIIAPEVQSYSATIVKNSCAETAIVVGVMGFLGMSFPTDFKSLGSALFFALVGILILTVAQIFMPPTWQAHTWIDWAAIVVFSLYVGYDFHRAYGVPRTTN